MKSWLADATTVYDISGMHYRPKAGERWDNARDQQRERKFGERLAAPPPVAPEHLPYFGTRLLDSSVIALMRERDRFTLRLDSINAGGFANFLAEVLDVPARQTTWPVDLNFGDVRFVRAASSFQDGRLHYLNLKSLVNSEFLYDWFFMESGRLQFIAQFWLHRHKWFNAYLMIDCAGASASDWCPSIFTREYGGQAAQLYLDALAGVDEAPIDFNVFHSSLETPAYIRRRMRAHRMARSSFVRE